MNNQQDFLIVDTEGKHQVNEIAVINSQGNLIYEAFVQEYAAHDHIKLNRKPLQQIILEFNNLAQNKLLICHHADHDFQVLQNSFIAVEVPWQNFQFACTYKLAKKYFPNLISYSLEYLSKKLNLKVKQKYFNSQQAHSARYDAEFTYQLYWKVMEEITIKRLQNQPNPFGSSRVDTPFQEHLDLTSIYNNQFATLKSIITDIKYDQNHQSKGVIVIGEPGTGKTHLMMRLAQEVLEVNRLLFIRQPNNPDAVIYHTYSRILESLIEKVTQSNYTQLEYLLANSFRKIIQNNLIDNTNQKDQFILAATQTNPLELYDSLGTDGTQKKRDYWQHIEKRTLEWWLEHYGGAGYSLEIIKGIIKFCSYSDFNYKKLVTRWLAADELAPEELDKIKLNNWNEEISKENFSLEAIAVLSKLSLLDEPLIIIFDQLEGLGLKHHEKLLLSFGEAIKEIFTHVPNSLIIFNLFPSRWQHFQQILDGSIVDRISQYQVTLEKPNYSDLEQILQLKAAIIDLDVKTLFTEQELVNILAGNSIRAVLNRAADYYRYKVNQIPLPQLSSQSLTHSLASEETILPRIEKLEQQFTQLQKLLANLAQAFSGFTNTLAVTNKQELQSNEPNNYPTNQEVIDYLETQKKLLEQDYDKLQIISDSDDIGKLKTIIEAFQTIVNLEIDHLRLGKKKIPDHLVVKKTNYTLVIGFLQIDGTAFTTRIKNFNELVINHKEIRFLLLRDNRKPKLTGKVAQEEITKLNNSANGKFSLIDRDNRISFEVIYRLVTDIYNRDFDVSLVEAFNALKQQLNNYWLIKLMQ
ncbi:Exonuclease RNase T and DNA polymerase III [Stanieria cyanosphaera PCC 7437]|uniref:Exonuclease RNase T and DNA polymerase III n=1 Tax=Stanieria cyanosphaera (strain ATCC 29371 / PCC 7437) TaxID=111780 RepID=K9XYT5_STAC7|nr:exonuclease domain-containing protein [Stanieria cyanosphaera]AFZ37291.1 Exonuclease RNase T and DNA polymerase III [Stanieria cyanosphaera PCC 7437]